MAVLIGIDEAGFGPILGPMVVSSAKFSLPKDILEKDFWQVLKNSVGSRRRHLAGRLLITDSKKAYSRSLGIKHLERTVLACLKNLGCEPKNLRELFSILCPRTLERLTEYPWYQKCEKSSFMVDNTDLQIAAGVLKDDLESKNIQFGGFASCCMDVGYYNRMVGAVKNKSSVLFTAICQLIEKAYKTSKDNNLQIIIDRQGGRVRYRNVLQKMFGDLELEILKENGDISSYELRGNGKKMRLHFVIGADSKYLPVSLASMVSKLVRELLVENINGYFTSFYGDLKPTAGYWKDGTRFIKELNNRPAKIEFDSNLLVRSR